MYYWKSGDANATCQRCGFDFKLSELKKTWDGFLVCKQDFEQRNELDFIRAVPEQNRLGTTAPEPPDQYVDLTYIDMPGDPQICDSNATVGFALIGCAIVGRTKIGVM